MEPLPAAVTAGHGRSKNQARQEPARVPVRSPNHGNHTPPTAAGGIRETSLAAAMARGRRPVPFRTWKLRPGTAMVLHPAGCGRVARRRTNTCTGVPGIGNTPTPRDPLPLHPHKTTSKPHKRTRTHGAHTRGTPCIHAVLAQISLCALHASLLCQGYIIREGTAWHIISCRNAALQPAKSCMCSVRRPCRLLTRAKKSEVCVCGCTNVVFVAHGTSLTRHLIPILEQQIRSDWLVATSRTPVSAVTSRVVVRHRY